MGVDQDRQATARQRRQNIISALRAGLDPASPDSYVARFSEMLRSDHARTLIINADIDGLVSAQMLSAVSGWNVGAVIERDGRIRTHPSVGTAAALLAGGDAFGVDVFSPLMPSVSNHPVHYGSSMRPSQPARVLL